MSDHDVFAEEVPATKLVMVKKVKMRGIYELDNHMKDLLKSRIQKVRDQASDISDTPRMPGPAASATNVGAGSPRGTSSPRAGGSAGGARQRKGASSGAVRTTRAGGHLLGGHVEVLHGRFTRHQGEPLINYNSIHGHNLVHYII